MRKLTEKTLVLATHNSGKLKEINEMLAPFGVEAKSAADFNLPAPEETGTTFEENAFIKAEAAMKATGLVALSDDSGMVVEALSGAPGIHTADWAEKPDGSGRDFDMAMARINDELNQVGATGADQRKASFVAVFCLVWPDGHCEYFRGEAPGTIVWPPRGEDGFGFDPIFMPDGHDTTFGEMSSGVKHSWVKGQANDGLSHRARAFARFARACLEA